MLNSFNEVGHPLCLFTELMAPPELAKTRVEAEGSFNVTLVRQQCQHVLDAADLP